MGYALIDANSFYASCEQVFRPDLADKAVVVLSNNDGCIIARNARAKKLGIKMGAPYFKVKRELKRHDVHIFSSNYALYADMSNRLMQTVKHLAPAVEVYSIDECFAATSGLKELQHLGQHWRQTICQWTGLTCGIGFGPTKTLAKLANHAAKVYPATGGVVDLSNPLRQQKLMRLVDVGEVWGVGRRLRLQLNALNIHTAFDLANCDPAWIKRRFNVVLARTVKELNGHNCLHLEEVAPAKKQIVCSRSFANKVTNQQSLSEAIAEYTARAAEKLRHEQQLCQMLTIFAHSNRFSAPVYSASRTVYLPEPTLDTRDLCRAALSALPSIYQVGVAYAKAGVLLDGLVGMRKQQGYLFPHPELRNNAHLMRTIDHINQHKRHSVYLAAQGIEQPWAMSRQYLSPAYTTRWSDLPTVH